MKNRAPVIPSVARNRGSTPKASLRARPTIASLANLLFVTLLVAVLPDPVSAQSDSAKAAAVVARHVRALGGEARLKEMKTLHMVMITSMPRPNVPEGVTIPGAMGGEVRSEVFMLAPASFYTKSDVPGVGVMEMGYDGNTAWSRSPMTGATILPDVPKAPADLSALPFSSTKIAYGGTREVDGKKYEVIHATMPDSTKATSWFDTATGLMARLYFEGTPASAGQAYMSFEDYQPFEGVLLARRQVTKMGEIGDMVMKVVSIDRGPIDPKIFAPPADAKRQPD